MARPLVFIFEVLREWTTHAWLCASCVEKRRAEGWTVRSRRLPPPRELVITTAVDGGACCDAALEDRAALECQDCHLARLPSCPTCGGPAVYPGAIGFDPCRDPVHIAPALGRCATCGSPAAAAAVVSTEQGTTLCLDPCHAAVWKTLGRKGAEQKPGDLPLVARRIDER